VAYVCVFRVVLREEGGKRIFGSQKEVSWNVQHGLIIENKHRIRHLSLNATKEVMMTQPT
jgi:hypothetical protein